MRLDLANWYLEYLLMSSHSTNNTITVLSLHTMLVSPAPMTPIKMARRIVHQLSDSHQDLLLFRDAPWASVSLAGMHYEWEGSVQTEHSFSLLKTKPALEWSCKASQFTKRQFSCSDKIVQTAWGLRRSHESALCDQTCNKPDIRWSFFTPH